MIRQVLVGLLVVGCAATPAATQSPVPTNSPVPSKSAPADTPSPTPSAAPSPPPAPTPAATATTSAQYVPLPDEGPNLFPGTYGTNFDPPLSLTIGHEVDLDCAPGYRCRGDMNVNEPDWLDFEFGNVHGSELMIFGFDKLADPRDPTKEIDPPADFAAWIAAQDGVSIIKPAHDVLVGGIPGVQLDIQNGDHGFGPSHAKVRLTALRIGGRQVVIQGTLGPENTVGDFYTAVNGLQAIIDSITWETPAPSGQIVFEDVGQDYVGTQVWIEDADGSNVHKLVSDSFTDGGVSLSPDGSRAVFFSSPDPSKPEGRIMLVDVDGTGLVELDTQAPVGCDEGPEGTRAWSPDGTRIAFSRFCFDPAGAFTGSGIWAIGVDGSRPKQVTFVTPQDKHEDHRASWSPDGAQLVFARMDTSVSPEKSALFTVPAEGGDVRQITPWELDANDPDWSPEGSPIAFNSPAESGGDQNIWVIAPDGTGLMQLTDGLSTWADGGQATYHPSWSPDGSQILFSHAPSTGGFADLFVMNRDGSGLHVLARTELAENHATWGGR